VKRLTLAMLCVLSLAGLASAAPCEVPRLRFDDAVPVVQFEPAAPCGKTDCDCGCRDGNACVCAAPARVSAPPPAFAVQAAPVPAYGAFPAPAAHSYPPAFGSSYGPPNAFQGAHAGPRSAAAPQYRPQHFAAPQSFGGFGGGYSAPACVGGACRGGG
jgi:hypothetical protein